MSKNISINPPDDDEEFERWCLWLAREKYGPNVFLYSRKTQYGIDIYWSQHGKFSVIQCKQRSAPNPAELISKLETDFETAQGYFGTNLEQFIFAATISLDRASKKVPRHNGNTESLMDAVRRLESVHKVTTACWHWDGIKNDIVDSPFLMAHLLGLEKGGDLISEDFFSDQNNKHGSDTDLKLAFYGSRNDVQWCGIAQQLDAPRQANEPAKEAIEHSFKNDHAVAALIKGDGGSGKSVLLRRLAHDLCAEYTVYWLESDIQSFLDCEWIYDVLKHGKADTPHKYLIFLEDWYQHVENSHMQKEATELLSRVGKTSYVRLVIGDRIAKPSQKKAYDTHVLEKSIFELKASENVKLLDTIFEKMPEWKPKNSKEKEQIEKAANATLFQLLFIFQYAEDRHGNIENIYKSIFKSDCRKLIDLGAFWIGMAKALFFYANLYVSEGFIVTVEFLRDLAAYFGNCDIPRYGTSIDELVMKDEILMKYLGLDTIKRGNVGIVNRFRFHHDTMADRGWMLLGSSVKEHYDEIMLQAVLKSFIEKYPGLLESTYFRQLRHPGNKGMEAARAYLNLSHPENSQGIFTSCLKKLRNEPLAKNKARDFLNTKKEPWLIKEAFIVCLDLLTNEKLEEDKALAKNKAMDFLGIEEPWENYQAFTVCLNLLKNEELAEDKALAINKARDFLNTKKEPWLNKEAFIVCLTLLKNGEIEDIALAKEKARDFLGIEKPWDNYQALSTCLDLLKDEKAGIDKSVFILENRNEFNADHHWPLLYHSLDVLHDKLEHQPLVTLVANEIIANRKGYRYGQLLKIPLFYLPQWVQSTEHAIRNWDIPNRKNYDRPWINRNSLNSITISYREKPELIEAMSLGLIRNWQFELRIKQEHQAYFIRCLAHPAIQQDEKLRQEVVAICKKILHCNTQPPLIIKKGTRIWLENIVEKNQFPEWNYAGLG